MTSNEEVTADRQLRRDLKALVKALGWAGRHEDMQARIASMLNGRSETYYEAVRHKLKAAIKHAKCTRVVVDLRNRPDYVIKLQTKIGFLRWHTIKEVRTCSENTMNQCINKWAGDGLCPVKVRR